MALLNRRTVLGGAVLCVAAVAAGATLVGTFSARKPAEDDATMDPEAMRPLSDIVKLDPAETLPPINFKTLDGADVTLAKFKGRPVVLNFWATWCGPCVKEMPELDRLASAQGPGGIAVLAVSADHGGAAVVRPFVAAHGIDHATILLDAGSDAVHALRLNGFPTTLIIDRDGKLRGRLEGPAAWGQAAGAVRGLTG
jgi:thiol-disulfide isomerase/thioredoxin